MKKLYSLLIVLCLMGCSNQNKEQKKFPKAIYLQNLILFMVFMIKANLS